MPEVEPEMESVRGGASVTLNLNSLFQFIVGALLLGAVLQLFSMNGTLQRIETKMGDIETRLLRVENRVGLGLDPEPSKGNKP